MIGKNLKYYRLKKNLTMKELASMVGVSPMSISYYESGERKPSMEVIQALAKALDVRAVDFLTPQNANLSITYGEFRKNSRLTEHEKEYVKAAVEEHMSRFYSTVDILGGEVMPDAPVGHMVSLDDDPEKCATAMRRYLGIAEFGPVCDLVELLENKGILVCEVDIDSKDFSGQNGTVNGRPYIALNKNMKPERKRSTIAHEMAHYVFIWPEDMPENEVEKRANEISGAFLFPAEDAVRELGIKRKRITKDMELTCKEYGVTMYLLTMRAKICGIITESAAKSFFIWASQNGWRKDEPTRITGENPTLFLQLVLRAVSENNISIQKGAELLRCPYEYVADLCFAAEG